MDDRDLMHVEADTGFIYDARGRMLLSNEPRERARAPAPRLYLGRTRTGHVVRFGAALPDEVTRRIGLIVACEPATDDLRAPPACQVEMVAALEGHAPIRESGSGPAYRFPEPVAPPRGEAVRITDASREIVRETFPWMYEAFPDWGICFAALHDGLGVALCFSSRVSPRAMAAGVFTHEAYRGHGHASTATAAWGAAVQAAGLVPLYGTSWDNLASQGVARRVGLIQYGTTTTWT